MHRRPRVLDLASAAALTALGTVEAVAGLTGAPAPWYVVATVPLVTGAVAVRSTLPRVAATVLFAAMLVQATLGSDLGGGFSEGIAMVLVLYSLGARLRLPAALGALVAAEAAVSFVIWSSGDAHAGNFVFGCTVVVVAWLAGRGVHSAAERSYLLSEHRALQERSRIAGELHDVVSHHVSAIVIQAGARRREVDPHDSPEAQVLEEIERRGRETLSELRRLLGLLRVDGTAGVPLSPQPGWADLPALVAASRDAGLAVSLSTHGDPARLGEGLELTVFRIVQEALTNAGKHAHDASVDVSIDCQPDLVGVEVVSHGGVRHRGVPGSGFGLRAMADRVHAYGGRLTAAPTAQGFRVHAEIPRGGEA